VQLTATVIDGKAIASKVEGEVQAEVARLREAGIVPRLDLVSVGGDAAFESYAAGRAKACERVGIESKQHVVPIEGAERAVMRELELLSADPRVDGILLQMPLPGGFDEQSILSELNPEKDVEGIHPENLGRLYLGNPRFTPCTPKAVMRILEEQGVDPAGRHAVIVGRSAVVGRALALLLMQKDHGGDATVTVCHSRTSDLAHYLRQAEILVAALGKPGAIHGESVRPGVIAIDVGTNRVPDPSAKSGSRLVGDFDYESVSQVASQITPVPGGVGPVTVAMLLANTVKAARRRAGRAGR
jgi:methylenetetrahydrofolate dehydrogenase (NADP+)/methenyltetrahydrofolate cyclohydrolase